jgi:hypothetical protein
MAGLRDPGASALKRVTPLVITDGATGVCGVLLAETTLAPDELRERLYDAAEAWLATTAGARLRAQALEAALRHQGELRLGLLEVLEEMLRRGAALADLIPNVTAARLLLDPERFGALALEEDEGVPVLFSGDAHGG